MSGLTRRLQSLQLAHPQLTRLGASQPGRALAFWQLGLCSENLQNCLEHLQNVCRLQPLQLVDPDSTRLGVGLPWQNCTSPLSFPDLPAGQYGFTLRATDYAGNVATSKCA